MKKKMITSGILMLLVVCAMPVTGWQLQKESVNGQGILVNEDGSRSRFTFNAKRNPNGKVTGGATIRNPSFKHGNGQKDLIQIDVTCLKVEGNIAIIGGLTKRKNDQAKAESVYFAVEESSKGGENKIFRGFYFDDDPSTEGDPQLCLSVETEVLVLEPIVEGNIQVKN